MRSILLIVACIVILILAIKYMFKKDNENKRSQPLSIHSAFRAKDKILSPHEMIMWAANNY